MKSKKADVSVLQGIVITIIVVALMLAFSGKLIDFFSSTGSTTKCQATIARTAIQEKLTFGISAPPTNCNNLPGLNIKKSDVVSGNNVSDYALKSLITNKMIDCWNMVGKGFLDPFHDYDDDQKYCLICSYVTFEDDFKKFAEDKNYELKDLLTWQAANTVPRLKTSYFNKLYGFEPNTEDLSKLKSETKFDLDQQYVVVWTMTKEAYSKPGAVALGATSATVGALGGAKAGAFLGGTIGTVIFPVGGTAVGAAVGALAGGAVGVAGAIFFISSGEKVLESGIHIVPSEMLGSEIKFGTETRPFCTKLVNS